MLLSPLAFVALICISGWSDLDPKSFRCINGQTCSEDGSVVKDAQLFLFDTLTPYGQNIYMLTSQLLVDPDIR